VAVPPPSSPSTGRPRTTCLCSLDESAYRSCSSPLELTNLLPGTHRFSVRALDRTIAAARAWDIGPIPTPTPMPSRG
jgi:hypothetical protein